MLDSGDHMVSVIMSSYNHENFIGESIESVRRQTYKNWELIIVDDGSEDDTAKVVRAIDDKRIRFYGAPHTGMAGKMKNCGIRMASGDLIAFIDSDDLWGETKLEKQISALKQYPEAGFSLTGGYNFRDRGVPIEFFYRKREGIRFDNIFLSCFRSEVAAFTQSLLLRKECLQHAGLFKEENDFPDMEFILGIARRFKAVILYEPLFYRRLHQGNFSTEQRMNWHYKGLEMIKTYKNELPPKVYDRCLFISYLNLGEKYLENKNSGKAIRLFLSAWTYQPFSIVPLKKIAKAILFTLKK